jgi:hypothetical protein
MVSEVLLEEDVSLLLVNNARHATPLTQLALEAHPPQESLSSPSQLTLKVRPTILSINCSTRT